ncbi:MAG: tryptophan synthase subunit alpha [Dehalococcoidia bacterium]
MSKRMRELFANAKAEGRKLFVPYVTAGYPRHEDTVPILLACEAGGGDIIELGMPFTDPLADGATIQHANQIALEHGISFQGCLDIVAEARAKGLTIPVVFMGYYNPLLAHGEVQSVVDAKAAGADGFIVVDLPADEAGKFIEACRANDMSFIPLIAPTTTDARIEELSKASDSWLYCVSVTGTTGGKSVDSGDVEKFVKRVREHTSLPLTVGFGISTRAQADRVRMVADAVAVGSAIIATIDAAEEDRRAQRVREFVEDVSGR